MTIENVKSKQRFEISEDEWRDVIVRQGNDYKYHIVNDSTPIEIKQLRRVEMKPKVEEVELPEVKEVKTKKPKNDR